MSQWPVKMKNLGTISISRCGFRDSHHKDKMVSWPPYLYNGEYFQLERQSLYWNGTHAISSLVIDIHFNKLGHHWFIQTNDDLSSVKQHKITTEIITKFISFHSKKVITCRVTSILIQANKSILTSVPYLQCPCSLRRLPPTSHSAKCPPVKPITTPVSKWIIFIRPCDC